ncbi:MULTISPECIES: terminase small subunit [Liquorilactobacillus]|uniref:terminase small subunit n=1 Tax=Liquorilactobacillus TaxID=2767888 RepID=UPI0039E7682F
MKLTLKQKKFADEYIISGNATDAAIKAGYSKKYAHTNASKLLQNTTIKNYIAERRKKIESQKTMDAKEAMELLTSIARGETKETVIVAAGPDVYSEEKEADLKTRISAVKEILKRYPNDDEVIKVQLRKLKAEADIAEVKAEQAKENGAELTQPINIIDRWESDKDDSND